MLSRLRASEGGLDPPLRHAESTLNEAKHTLFRCADDTTGGNVDTVPYGDTFLTQSTRPSRTRHPRLDRGCERGIRGDK